MPNDTAVDDVLGNGIGGPARSLKQLPPGAGPLRSNESMDNTRVFRMAFASVYPHYVAKVEKKGRTKEEVHAIIQWLTGYDEQALQHQIDKKVDFETFFARAPRINRNVSKITGVICGYRVEEIEDKLMQQIRYLDKLVDELAKGKAMDKILRK